MGPLPSANLRLNLDQTPAARALARRNKYVEENLALVERIAKHIMQRLPPCFEYDDLRQAGYLGLIDAAAKFKRSFNVPFPQYAKCRIRGEIIESVRRRHWKNATHLPITENVLEMPAAGGSDAIMRRIEHGQEARIVAEAIDSLPERHRKVVEIYFRDEGKLAAIGEEFGVRQSRSSQLLQMAKRETARELGYRGLKAA